MEEKKIGRKREVEEVRKKKINQRNEHRVGEIKQKKGDGARREKIMKEKGESTQSLTCRKPSFHTQGFISAVGFTVL